MNGVEKLDLIERAVAAMTPMVTNSTHAWNLWNYLNTSEAFIAAFRACHPEIVVQDFCTPGCPEFCTGSPDHASGPQPSREEIAEMRARFGLDPKPVDSET